MLEVESNARPGSRTARGPWPATIRLEPGSDPGSGIKWYHTFLLYFVAPVGLFLGITAIVLLSSRPKKN